MNYIDIVILVVLGIFGIGGLRKGIITEAATLLGLGVGLYGAFHFSDFTAEKLVQWVEINPKYLNVIAFVVTFLVLAIVVNLLGRLVAKMVKAINLGFIDKLGGFIIGMAKGVLICSLLVMLLNALEIKNIIKDKDREGSMLYPYIEQTVPYVYQGFDLVKEAVKEATDDDDTEEVDTDEKTENQNSPVPIKV
jgi:membrane protein required for colicin V production